jgi:probable phosphoglycerate mutase
MGTVELIGLVSAFVGIISFIWWLYEKWLPYRNISWKRAEKAAKEIAEKMTAQGFSPSMIMGIGRGGAILGSLISGALGHRPLIVIDRKYEWTDEGRLEDMMLSVKIPFEYTRSVLLVAGEAHSGRTLRYYYDYLKSIGAQDIKRAVLLLEEGCPFRVEYYGVRSDKKTIRLPWMSAKHYIRGDREPQVSSTSKPHFKVKVHFIRHAETSAGEDVFVGRSDADLSVRGVEQAIDLGQLFSGKRISTIYSSPAGRALKTARILNSFIETEFIVEERLREIEFGAWDGLGRSAIKRKYGPVYSQWTNDPSKVVPEGGEKPACVLERLQSFLEDVVNRYKLSENIEVVAVSHKTAVRIIVSFIEKGSIANYREREVKNTEMISLVFDGKQWNVDTNVCGSYHTATSQG